MNFFKREKWSPYLVGALIGILSWVTFAGMNKALGTSTTFVRAAGSAQALVAPEHVKNTEYYAKYLDGSPAFDWQFALVLAMILGAFAASKLSGQKPQDPVPSIWAQSLGSSRPKRFVGAFLGGVLVLFGARLAGGCTSGHGISGGLQLAVSSWVFLGALFAAGIPTALMLYKNRKA